MPKTPRKKSVAESWAEGYRAFTEACREHWGFLNREHGFAEPKVVIQPPSCMVTFTRDGDWVRIASEYAGQPWVVIKVGEGEPFGLDVMIAELEPEYEAKKPVPERDVLTDDEMRAVVAYQAAFVQRHAEEILSRSSRGLRPGRASDAAASSAATPQIISSGRGPSGRGNA